MLYALRVNNSGVFIHEGHIPRDKNYKNFNNSHGCIRIHKNNAQKFFNWAEKGITVNIIGKSKLDDTINTLRREEHEFKITQNLHRRNRRKSERANMYMYRDRLKEKDRLKKDVFFFVFHH